MVKPYIVKIKDIDYLVFDECYDTFINGYKEKIEFKDLEEYIKFDKRRWFITII